MSEHPHAARYDDNEIIEQIQLLAGELDRPPTIEEFDDDSRTCTYRTVRSHFGSWNAGVEAAGYESRPAPNVSGYANEELLAQIQLLVNELDRIPSWTEFRSDDRVCHPSTLSKHFGSWRSAVEQAGFDPEGCIRGEYSKEEILEDIWLLAQATGNTPTSEQFQACPYVCSLTPVRQRFGTWNAAVAQAGLEPRGSV